MNKARRKKLEEVISTLEDMRDELTHLHNEERDAFDNLPDSLQYSEKGEEMEECADALEENTDSLDDVINNLIEISETY